LQALYWITPAGASALSDWKLADLVTDSSARQVDSKRSINRVIASADEWV